VHVPPPVIYIVGFLAGLLLQRAFPVLNEGVRPRRVLGAAGLGLSVALAAPSLGLFVRARTSPIPVKPATALVTSGPYRFTRNPMYLGMVFAYAGLALWSGVVAALLVLPLVVVVVDRYVIAREERYLERAFGDQYRQYKVHVRRWLWGLP
jgi:protein-S-isoprenylcysteine O-methyltransferase Ste14